MAMISIIHPSRGRAEKSASTIEKWRYNAESTFQLLVSVDEDDDYISYSQLHNLPVYSRQWPEDDRLLIGRNKSCVDAINKAAKIATGNVFIVVSDDSDCFQGWDTALLKELEGKSDYLLKTDDGIQDYIVTMTVMDRKYYERDGFIYHPSYEHLFADTYLTCVADIRGRIIKSKLKFPHLHYSYSGGKEMPDALHRRNDATWMTGQYTFVRLMKEFTPEERARIKNPGMRGFLRKFGL